jgi:hypothetical protein
VVILQHCTVVVEDGQLRAGVDVKVVGGARVVKVVDHGRHQRREDLQIGNPVLRKDGSNMKGGFRLEASIFFYEIVSPSFGSRGLFVQFYK